MSVVKNLIKEYKTEASHFALNVACMEILDVGVTCLEGPSGSGKTTIIRHLVGLESCAGAEWQFDGQNLFDLPCGHRGVGIVFQKDNLFPHLTVLENVTLPLNRKPNENEKSEVAELLKDLGVENKETQKAKTLSGGEEQRVALARALFMKSKIILLDEPFSALDSDSKTKAKGFLKKIINDFEIPILLITHDENDKRELADKVISIHSGRLLS